MTTSVQVAIHPSQFPENVRRDLLASLRTRRVNHKFHYDSVRQTQKWLALHRQFSPSLNDADCLMAYDRAFAASADRIHGGKVQLIGLCCGDGRKDARLLRLLCKRGMDVSYVPCDGSIPLALLARAAAEKFIQPGDCHPFVCDLQTADNLPACFSELTRPKSARLVTFFGTVHNFEPDLIFPRLAALLRRDDLLLMSANLAPGADYESGMRRILPQYKNRPTLDWLGTFLADSGFPLNAGKMKVVIEQDAVKCHLQRIAIYFVLSKDVSTSVAGERLSFRAGEAIRLFFSYRYSPELAAKQFDQHGLKLLDQWCSRSGQEGIFLCGKKRQSAPAARRLI
jgi:L-histidine N-alpha-methyltransferase